MAVALGRGEWARRLRAAVTARRTSCSRSLLISSTILRINFRADSLDFLGIWSLSIRRVEAKFKSGSSPSNSSGSSKSCLSPLRSMASFCTTATISGSKRLRKSPSHLEMWGEEGPRPAPRPVSPKPSPGPP